MSKQNMYEDDIMPDGTLAPQLERTEPDTAISPKSTPSIFAGSAFTADDDWNEPDSAPRFTRRRLIIGGTVVVLLAVLGGIILHALQPAAVPLAFTNGVVVRDNLTITTSSSGQVTSGIYNLNFLTSGKIAEIDVSPGQIVQAGQLLAKIDPTQLQDALNSAQNSFNAAGISLNNAYTNQTNSNAVAYDNYQQALVSAGTNAAKQQQGIDQYNQAVAQAQASVNSAQASYTNAQTQLTTAQHNFTNVSLTAPVAGQIASITGQVGTATASNFIVLVNLSTFTINAQVNEADIGNVQVNQPVSFTVQAFPSSTFYGTIATISPIGTTTQSVVTYPVSITVDTTSLGQNRLFPGMTAQLTITTKQVIDAVLVPNASLTYARNVVRAGRVTSAAVQAALVQARSLITAATDPAIQQGTASYVLQEQKGKAIIVPIVIGITDSTNTVVLAGLNENDSVILTDNKITTTTTTTSGGQRTGGGASSIFGNGR